MCWPDTEGTHQSHPQGATELTAQAHASPGAKDHLHPRVLPAQAPPPRYYTRALPPRSTPRRSARPTTGASEPAALRTPATSTALGRETDHRGNPALGRHPAEPVTAEEMLGRPSHWATPIRAGRGKPDVVAELAGAWGVRADARGVIFDFEAQEAAVSPPTATPAS